MTLKLDNRTARRIFIERQGLAAAPHRKQSRDDLQALIEKIGFVQIDTISTVERAHHMILFARNQTYRREDLSHLLEQSRSLFENWTHDAAIIPSDFYPYWQHRFDRVSERLKARWRKWRRQGFEEVMDEIKGRIRDQGPAMSRDFAKKRQGQKSSGAGWWDWHPEKTALEYLWRTGELAVARRQGFQKVYDLADRIIPDQHLGRKPDPATYLNWACRGALDRLGFATSGEIARFWDLVTPAEAKQWQQDHDSGDLVDIMVTDTAGEARGALAFASLENDIERLPTPSHRVRVISPFDPLIRDRNRLARLFGFDYRIEVFVPAAKREYGYYVFPLLEGDRFIGRIDMKHERQSAALVVAGLWLEAGIKFGRQRQDKLEAELARIAKFIDARDLVFPARAVKTR